MSLRFSAQLASDMPIGALRSLAYYTCVSRHAASLSAFEICASVAFSASLTSTPPIPRKPPSGAASATCWLIWRSHPLKAAASPGAFASTTAPACRSVSIHLAVISADFKPRSFSFNPSRAVLRPWEVSKSETTALMSGFAAGSILAFTSSLLLANPSFRSPHNPLGSAAVTAMPAIITLSSKSFHSSGEKLDLSDMDFSPQLYCWGQELHCETRLMAMAASPLCHRNRSKPVRLACEEPATESHRHVALTQPS